MIETLKSSSLPAQYRIFSRGILSRQPTARTSTTGVRPTTDRVNKSPASSKLFRSPWPVVLTVFQGRPYRKSVRAIRITYQTRAQRIDLPAPSRNFNIHANLKAFSDGSRVYISWSVHIYRLPRVAHASSRSRLKLLHN